MTVDEALQVAQRFMDGFSPGVAEPMLLHVEEYDACYVVHWTSRRARETKDPADAPPPGVGPIAVPKDGAEARYLSSQPLPLALYFAGLGPEPPKRERRW